MSEQNKIEQIKARHAAATPGPWKFSVSHREYGLYGGDDRILSFGGRVGFDEFRGQEPGMDDEDFIGHSWEDVEFLLQEIERRDKALEWANRIIGSGVDVDAPLRYDPQYWLLQYHEHMAAREAL